MSDVKEEPNETGGQDEPEIQTDANGLVECQIQVTVMPDSVSGHYQIKPIQEGAHVVNMTAKFVHLDEGVVDHSFGGASIRALVDTKSGQGFLGDLGADTDLFGEYQEISMIIAGVVEDKDHNPFNFFFVKDFNLKNEE